MLNVLKGDQMLTSRASSGVCVLSVGTEETFLLKLSIKSSEILHLLFCRLFCPIHMIKFNYLIALLNLSVLGFSFLFHDKAKRRHQGNLQPFDVLEEPPPVLLPVCVQCVVSRTKRVLFKTRKPLCNIVIELELSSFLDHLFHPWQASDLLSLVLLSRPA